MLEGVPAQAQFYYDNQSLFASKRMANQGGDAELQALKSAAKQFESLFTSMMLKSSRNAKIEGGLFDSSAMETFQGMYDQQLSNQLSSGQGMGLAESLYQQLKPMTAAGQRELIEARREQASAGRTGGNTDGNTGISPLDPAASGTMMPLSMDRVDPRWLSGEALPDKASWPIELQALPELGRVSQNSESRASSLSDDPSERFIQTLAPVVEREAARLGVDPRVVLAQAALETGWGQHMPKNAQGESSHNLFGIKATRHWQGERAYANTLEVENGQFVPQRAAFRAYQSPEDSVKDYVDFILKNPRYEQALKQAENPSAYLHNLQQAGYATDPEYADKILQILEQNVFTDRYSELKKGTESAFFS